MRRDFVLGAMVVFGVCSIRMAAVQQSPPPAPLPAIQKVKDNLFVITGSDTSDRSKFTGGNVGVFVTDTGWRPPVQLRSSGSRSRGPRSKVGDTRAGRAANRNHVRKGVGSNRRSPQLRA